MSNYIKQIELVQNGKTDLIDIGTPHLVEITWSDLNKIKSNNKLVPGSWYRITDYYCTTTISGTTAANNQFDIVTLAVSENTLSNECRAMKSKTNATANSYFSSANLDAWKIWYCFDNNATKYTWTKTDGKGVIYRMIDEHGNDCPYDFKNIKFNNKFTFNNSTNNTDRSVSGEAKNNVIKPYKSSGNQYLNKVVLESQTNIYGNTVDDECHNITMYSNTAKGILCYTYIHQGISGTDAAPVTLETGYAGQNFELNISKDKSGTIYKWHV